MPSLDRQLAEQVNLILHHPEFQQLEASWRGLQYLVTNTDTGSLLKIKLLDISKRELRRTLRKFHGTAWDQSPLFHRVYEEEYGQLGGEPYGVLIGDYEFDHRPEDVQLLAELSQTAAAAHTPFIAAAAPSVMQMDSWAELANPRDLTRIFQTPEYTAWRSLRDSEDARYLGLCLPRFLARLPYGARTDPVDGFAFEEDVEGPDGRRYLWTNAAYAMAANLARAFSLYGWCVRIRGVDTGGAVEGLPVLTFPTADGDVDRRCSTEARAERAAGGGTGAQRLHPAGASQGIRFRGVHRRAFAAKAAGIRRPGGHRECHHLLAPALSVRLLPFRALFEVHGARQGRQFGKSRPTAELAA